MRFLITILFIWNVMEGFHSTNLRRSKGKNRYSFHFQYQLYDENDLKF